MTNIIQTIENTLTTYQTGEFFPIYREGKLDNRADFVTYKAHKLVEGVGFLATRTVELAGAALDHIVRSASK